MSLRRLGPIAFLSQSAAQTGAVSTTRSPARMRSYS